MSGRMGERGDTPSSFQKILRPPMVEHIINTKVMLNLSFNCLVKCEQVSLLLIINFKPFCCLINIMNFKMLLLCKLLLAQINKGVPWGEVLDLPSDKKIIKFTMSNYQKRPWANLLLANKIIFRTGAQKNCQIRAYTIQIRWRFVQKSICNI